MPKSMLDKLRDWLQPIEPGENITLAPEGPAQSTYPPTPHAFVIDDEEGVCKAIILTLTSMGVTSEKFYGAREAIAALMRGLPSIVFLDVALQGSDAIDVIRGLAEHGFGGVVQLMSGSNVALLDDVRRVGMRHGLNMRAPLSKPFRPQSIRQIVEETHLTRKPGFVAKLDEARENGWLELWYQPKVDLRKSALAGAEGLVRCRHPTHGILEPASFLTGASESSHSALTEFVITTALRDWNEIAESRVPLHIAVNTSVGALANLQLPAVIRDNLPKSDRWPGLILEVTESDVVKEASLIHEIATQLRIYRITLAIDDFGEGFSSFARLRDIPFAELKLDRSFVKNSGTDKRNASICQTIINLAHDFGAVAVAEGIDNATDLRAVHRMGCDIGQGYFLARPMPKKDLIALLRERAEQNPTV